MPDNWGLPMDRLASITAFLRVAEIGSFTAAARRLNLSTTRVSEQVQALEHALGVRLLYRTTRRVSLTEVGHEYYERCSQAVLELDEADRFAGALQTAPAADCGSIVPTVSTPLSRRSSGIFCNGM